MRETSPRRKRSSMTSPTIAMRRPAKFPRIWSMRDSVRIISATVDNQDTRRGACFLRVPEPRSPKKKPQTRPGLSRQSSVPSLSEVGAERLRAGCVAKAANRLLLDLSDALARQLEALANFLERQRMFPIEPEVESDHLGLAIREGRESAAHFDLQRFRHQPLIGCWLRLVGEDVEKS